MTPDPMLAILWPLLRREEGLRLQVYDDATGQVIGPGCLVRGHPTIGIGRCLDRNGITEEEAEYLLRNDAAKIMGTLDQELPWWRELSPTRQAVLAAMAFQLGCAGLMAFRTTLRAIQAGDFEAAAKGMLASGWARQTPGRAQRMAAMVRTG